MFDSLYHKDVLISLFLSDTDWEWIVIHPTLFKEQQSGMIENLWKLISDKINFNSLANKFKIRSDLLRSNTRIAFLNHFTHYWINEDGSIEKTKPKYLKNIIHEAV